jgi:hypothetical protein
LDFRLVVKPKLESKIANPKSKIKRWALRN